MQGQAKSSNIKLPKLSTTDAIKTHQFSIKFFGRMIAIFTVPNKLTLLEQSLIPNHRSFCCRNWVAKIWHKVDLVFSFKNYNIAIIQNIYINYTVTYIN